MPNPTSNHVAASLAATTRVARIAALNYTFRRSFSGGRVMVSAGVAALPEPVRTALIAAVRAFEAFDPDNDPHDEHDCASFEAAGVCCLWKIDPYDLALRAHSPEPADPNVTTRVLTIMLAEEY